MSVHSEDSEDEGVTTVRLADILTIRQAYDLDSTSRLKLNAPPPDEVKYNADPGLLDRVSLHQGDITDLEVDAIVNAANKSLLGGGGVDGSIHRAAGPHLLEECRTLNGCLTGQSKITRGYCLPSRHIIHTVGPVYTPDEVEQKAKKLASCYRTSLEVAVENELRHVAFPAVSTGVYGYPIEEATRIALDEVRRFLETENGSKIERVIFVVWSNKDRDIYRSLIPEYFPPESDSSEKEETKSAADL